MLLGPVEAFHVPFYRQSLAGAPTDLVNSAMKTTDETCSGYYGKYFTLTSIELNAKEVNPLETQYGLCAYGWLHFVQFILLVQAILWFATFLVSAPVLLGDPIQGKVNGKVGPVPIATASEEKEPGVKEP